MWLSARRARSKSTRTATTRNTARTTGRAPARTKTKGSTGITRPSKVKIGPLVFTVEWDGVRLGHLEETEFRGVTLSGASRGRDQVMVIRPGMGPEWEKDTLLHEILHMIFSTMGSPIEGDEEEKLIGFVSPLLLGVLRDNPQVVRYLCS